MSDEINEHKIGESFIEIRMDAKTYRQTNHLKKGEKIRFWVFVLICLKHFPEDEHTLLLEVLLYVKDAVDIKVERTLKEWFDIFFKTYDDTIGKNK